MKEFKIEEIALALNSNDPNSKRFVIPVFQRGKRWDINDNKNFVDSLRKGYPVGSFLLYTQEDGDDPKEFVLVDGLQRSICAQSFCCNPEKYLGALVDLDTMSDEIAKILKVGKNNTIKQFLEETIINGGLYREMRSYEIFYQLCDSIGFKEVLSTEENKRAFKVIDEYLMKIKDVTEKVRSSKIPCIVYKGSSDNLNEIFRRINQLGERLTRYEIYAASWPQKEKQRIEDEVIVKYVAGKYNSFICDNLVVQGYDENTFLKKKELTAFEFLFGLGKKLVAEHSFLEECKKNDKDNAASDVNDFAFILVNACLNSSMSDMQELYKPLNLIDLNLLESKIIEALRFVEDSLAPFTLFKGNNKSNNKKKVGRFPAKYHAIAMISSCFREMFTLNETLAISDSWKQKKEEFAKNLRQHFVYETINADWNEGNQGKVFSFLNKKTYSNPVDKNDWNMAIEKYYLESKKELKKDSASKNDILLLNAIYCHQFSSFQQNDESHYHVDHIVPKANLRRKCEKLGNKYYLPVSTIANFCYLTDEMNQVKGDNTIYSSKKFKEKYDIAEVEERYVFTQSEELKWFNNKNLNLESLKNHYLAYIDSRFIVMKKKLCESLGIGYLATAPTEDQTIATDVAVDSVCRECAKILSAKFEINGNGVKRERFLINTDTDTGFAVAYSTYRAKRDGSWFYTISKNRCKNITNMGNKKLLFVALGNGRNQETRVYEIDWEVVWDQREQSTGGRRKGSDSMDVRLYFDEEGNVVWKHANFFTIPMKQYQII